MAHYYSTKSTKHEQRDERGRYKEPFKRKVVKFMERELKSRRAKNMNQAARAAQMAFGLPNRFSPSKWYEDAQAQKERDRKIAIERDPFTPTGFPKLDDGAGVVDLSEEAPSPEIEVKSMTIEGWVDGAPVEPSEPVRSLSSVAAEYDQLGDEITGHMIQVDELNNRRNKLRTEIDEILKGM